MKREQFAGVQVGTGFVNEKLSAGYTYRPYLFHFRYSVSISKKEKRNHLFFFHVEPQWNAVSIAASKKPLAEESQPEHSSLFEWETGINAGFDYQYYFGSNYLLLGFGSGPHYISAAIDKQAKGFIFSDNFYAGLGKIFSKGISACLKINFRHLSNAGLNNPNSGIDNFILLLGISKRL